MRGGRIVAAMAFWICLGPGAPAGAQEDWEARYAERAGTLAADDTRGHYALARWCEQCDRPEEAARHYRMILRVDPAHARARQCLEALGVPPEGGASPGGGPDPAIPRAPGQYDLLLEGFRGSGNSPAAYTLRIPEAARLGRPLPLAIICSYRSKESGDPDTVLPDWVGFEGYVAVVMYSAPEYDAFTEGVAEALVAAGGVDRTSILVTDCQAGFEVPFLVARRPDLFRYGYSDSTWGGRPFPGIPPVTPEQRDLLRDVHVYMKLTGEGFKADDRGYDDARAAEVRAYWEALGVRDVVVERYPKSSTPGRMDPSCIGVADANQRARAWFERKMREESELRRLLAEYERRASAVREGDVPALLRLGGWCESQGLAEKAIELYRRVLDLDPGHAQALRFLERLSGGS